MPLIKLDNSLSSIRGRFGGTYFTHSRYGQQSKSFPRVIRSPLRTASNINILGFTGLKAIAALLAILYLLAGWVFFAGQWMHETEKNRLIKMSWWNWFVHFNLMRVINGLPAFLEAPHSPQELPDFVFFGMFFGELNLNTYLRGYYNLKPVFWHDDGDWAIWYEGGIWYVSREPGVTFPETFWYRYGENPEGLYQPHFESDGTIFVSL
jgi:hypothetical protein